MKLVQRTVFMLGFMYVYAKLSLAEAVAATLGERAQSLSTEVSSFASLAMGGFVLIGFVLFCMGIIGMRKSRQEGGNIGQSVITTLIGALLFSIGTITTIFSESLTGTGDTDLGKIGL